MFMISLRGLLDGLSVNHRYVWVCESECVLYRPWLGRKRTADSAGGRGSAAAAQTPHEKKTGSNLAKLSSSVCGGGDGSARPQLHQQRHQQQQQSGKRVCTEREQRVTRGRARQTEIARGVASCARPPKARKPERDAIEAVRERAVSEKALVRLRALSPVHGLASASPYRYA